MILRNGLTNLSLGSLADPHDASDNRDRFRFVYPYQTLMLDSYNLSSFGITEILSPILFSVAAQAVRSPTWSKILKTCFPTWPVCMYD